jgi:hypothetical protein
MSTDSTAISIRVPEVRDKDVKISLNKWEGLWSALSPLEIRFLVIVHWDISRMRVTKAAELLIGYSSQRDGERTKLVIYLEVKQILL